MRRGKSRFYAGLLILFVFVVACIFVGVFLMHHRRRKTRDSYQDSNHVKVIIYENSKTPTRTANLEKLLEKFNYDYDIIGKGEKWDGWYGRLQTCVQYLNELGDEDYVLLSDGRDVIVCEESSAFSEKAIRLYNEKGDKIIFNGETLCCVAGKEFKGTEEEKKSYFQMVRDFFEKIQPMPAPPLYTLNYGLAFGKVRDFKEMFRIMDLKRDEDDQGILIQRIMNGEFTNYVIDYNNTLFGIMYNLPPKWDNEKKRYSNPTTKSFPSFLHFPGKSKDYDECAKTMCRTYLNEQAIL